MRKDLDRTILPNPDIDSKAIGEAAHVMWSNTAGKGIRESAWLPNHFVVCIKEGSPTYYLERYDIH